MTTFAKPSRGFSLIELMVALVAGLIVSYAVLAFTMSSMKSNAEYVQSTKLTQGLRNTLDLVVRDLRRAGYDEVAVSRLAGGGDSPFGPVLIDNSDATNGSCIIYAYDRPGGTAGTLEINNGEIRGLRRRVVTPTGASASVGVIEYAVSNSTAGKPTCGGADAIYTSYPPSCNTASGSGWCPLTDTATINIRAFNLTEAVTTAISNTVRARNVKVEITGRLVGDNSTSYLNGVSNSYKRGVEATVKIRTDCVRSAVANCNVSP